MRSGALRIAIIYLVVAVLWITLSDRILFLFHSTLSAQTYLLIGSAKGYFFVAVTAGFLYKLVRLEEKKFIASSRRSIKSDDEVQRLDNIITKVNNIIIVTDQNNDITWVNKAFEDFTGYCFEDVAGHSPATFFADGETDLDLLSDILKKKNAMKAFAGELNCSKKNGEKFWVSGEYTPIFNSRDEFKGYIAVYSDITDLKEKERETRLQNAKLREVAWLSSHEVRRPLANIIGLANLMKVTPNMDERVEIIERVGLSAGELDEIVHVIHSKIYEGMGV